MGTGLELVIPALLEAGAADAGAATFVGAGLADAGLDAGVASMAGNVLVGSAMGALGSEITGGNPLMGALMGGAGGGVGGALGGAGSAASTALGSGTSAAAGAPISAGPGFAAGNIADLTADANAATSAGATIPGMSVASDSSLIGAANSGWGGAMAGTPVTLSPAGGLGANGMGLFPGASNTIGQMDTDLASLGDMSGPSSATSAASSAVGSPAMSPGNAISSLTAPGPSAGAASSLAPTTTVPGTGGTSMFPGATNTINQLDADVATFGGAAPASTGGAAASSGGLLSKGGFLDQHGLQLAMGVAPMIMGNQQPQGMKALEQLQSQEAAQAASLRSGILPPGAQNAVRSAVEANIANIRATYAKMGMQGSTMEAQAIQGAYQDSANQATAMVQNFMKMGMDESAASAQMLATLMNINMQQDQALSQGIANFAGALGKYGGGNTDLSISNLGNMFGTGVA